MRPTSPRLDAPVPGLAASAIQAAAVGIVLRNTRVAMLSPLLACAAWLVSSSGAMGDNAQWVTVPLGLAILAVVEQGKAAAHKGMSRIGEATAGWE